VREGSRGRTLYEIASSFFAAVVILFAALGMLVIGLGPDGPASAGFLICSTFLALGLGRLYLGLKRGDEGAGDQALSGRLSERHPEHDRRGQHHE